MNRREALATTGTALTAALGSLALSTLPAASATLAEAPLSKVRRLAFELAHAMDEWCADLAFDGKPDVWVAHIYPASHTAHPVAFNHVDTGPTAIERLAEAWQVQCDADDDYDEYVRLQKAVLAIEPGSLRDLALQYWVDTGMGASCESEGFEDRLKRLADWEGLMEGRPVTWPEWVQS